MASSLDFVEYICEQIDEAGSIRYKKMFGEYGFYCDEKFFGLVCDNQFFIKVTENGKELMPDCDLGSPYEKAKPHFLISNLEDKEFLSELIIKTCQQLTLVKKKKK